MAGARSDKHTSSPNWLDDVRLSADEGCGLTVGWKAMTLNGQLCPELLALLIIPTTISLNIPVFQKKFIFN